MAITIAFAIVADCTEEQILVLEAVRFTGWLGSRAIVACASDVFADISKPFSWPWFADHVVVCLGSVDTMETEALIQPIRPLVLQSDT
jgi:hypothetical protein